MRFYFKIGIIYINYLLLVVAFANEEKTVLVIVNNGEDEKDIKFLEKYPHTEIYVTDSTHSCEKVADSLTGTSCTLSAKSITTFVFSKTL